MKNTLITFCISMAVMFSVKSQSLVMDFDSLHADGNTSQLDIIIDNQITNDLGMLDSIRWIRTQYLPAGWQTLVCDPVICYGPNTNSMAFDLDDQETGPIIIHYKPNGIVGEGLMDLLLYAYSDSANTAIHAMFSCAVDQYNNVEVTKITSAVSLYPNPATDLLHVHNFSNQQIGKVEIYNIFGTLVTTVNYNDHFNPMKEISVDKLYPGLYILKAWSVSCEVMMVKTFKKVN